MKLETRSVITDGRTTEFARDFLKIALRRFEGKEVVISIETYYPTITGKQNRFVHGVFLPALYNARRAAGEDITQEQNRADFKNKYGPHEAIRNEAGEWEYLPKSVADWNTKETEDAMEQCRADYATFVELPFPNEDYLNQQ